MKWIKMKTANTIMLTALCLVTLLLVGCNGSCSSKLYTTDGKCCTYVCETVCEDGYLEGTCHCACADAENLGDDGADMGENLGEIFGDDPTIIPPPING
ncbi:MAG: hypothetical protein KKG59_05450 [Nanoarchaeota archaeon]|nr:hypothetical protein [Nanoarchaeota archaeon]